VIATATNLFTLITCKNANKVHYDNCQSNNTQDFRQIDCKNRHLRKTIVEFTPFTVFYASDRGPNSDKADLIAN